MRHTIYNIGMAAALLAATAFCTCCTREMQGQKPEIILETVSEGIVSATFSISAPGASALSYVQMPDKPDIPSAKAIIAGGLSVPPSGKTITLDGLLPGHSYAVAAIDAGRSADADDAATYRLFLEKIKEMDGSMPLPEYLERAGHTGTGEGLLDGLEEGTYSVRIASASGSTVHSSRTDISLMQPYRIDLRDIAPGQYHITITGQGKEYRSSFAKI